MITLGPFIALSLLKCLTENKNEYARPAIRPQNNFTYVNMREFPYMAIPELYKEIFAY